MNLSDLKRLFLRYIKVVPGGPTDKTRGAGMLVILNTLAELATAWPNNRPDFGKACRFYLAADRNESPDKGDCFEELDFRLCALSTIVNVERYRLSQTDDFQYNVRLTAIYDPTSLLQVSRSGSRPVADGDYVPARFVPIDSPEAQYGYVRRDTSPASITDWRVGELSIWEINGQDQFATAKQAGGVFLAYTGVETAYWKPAAAPSPGNGGGERIDLLDLTTEQMDQVMNLTYVNCDADPAASPGWSHPGHEFDAIDPADGGNYHYYCRRQTYVRGNPATGVGPAWHRVAKV